MAVAATRRSTSRLKSSKAVPKPAARSQPKTGVQSKIKKKVEVSKGSAAKHTAGSRGNKVTCRKRAAASGANEPSANADLQQKMRQKKKKVAKKDVKRGKPTPAELNAAQRVPVVVEQAFYECGSIILKHLIRLVEPIQEAIRQAKILLDMALIERDVFAEAFGGRLNVFEMRKAELVRLGTSLGIKGLGGMKLEEARKVCKPLSLLSETNYKLWNKSAKRRLSKSITSCLLPGEPRWMEDIINTKASVYTIYRADMKNKLKLPEDLVHEMKSATSGKDTGWHRYYNHYDPYDYYDRVPGGHRTTYQYRGSTALSAAIRWRKFTGRSELDLVKIRREVPAVMNSIRTEKKLREAIMDRVELLRAMWKKHGRNLGGNLGHLNFGQHAVTMDFLSNGGDERLQAAELALEAVMKFGERCETEAMELYERTVRYDQVVKALKKKRLEVPAALDPTKDDGASDVCDVRQQHDKSWSFIRYNRGSLEESIAAHEVFVELKGRVATESEAVARKEQLERLEMVKDAWVKHNLDDAEKLGVPMPPEMKEKYQVTTQYILGGFSSWSAVRRSKTLESTIATRINMHAKRHPSELSSLTFRDVGAAFNRKGRHKNGWHKCPCGLELQGKDNMVRHLEENEGRDAANHTRY